MIEYWLGNMYIILGMNLGMITAIAIALAYDKTKRRIKLMEETEGQEAQEDSSDNSFLDLI